MLQVLLAPQGALASLEPQASPASLETQALQELLASLEQQVSKLHPSEALISMTCPDELPH